MKVLVVGPKSVHVSNYIAALGKAGITPDLLAEESCDFENVSQEFHISFRSTKPWNVMRSVQDLKRVLKQVQPDIVHIHQVNRLAYFTARTCDKMNIPVVTTAWGSDVLIIPQANAFYKMLVRKTLERSAIITADSEEMIQAMKKLHASDRKYHLLQYGVDVIQSQDKVNVIYSNRLHEPIYRIDQIINYAADFFQNHPDWKLVVGAVGTLTEALKEQVKDLGIGDKVEFVGWLQKSDNQNWYAKSSVYISIPKHDGTAVSLLEAMSAGCIPIVSDLAVSREWIKQGENGIIEEKNVNPLVKALEMDSQKCAEINRKLIQEKASRDNCTKSFVKFYQEIVRTEVI